MTAIRQACIALLRCHDYGKATTEKEWGDAAELARSALSDRPLATDAHIALGCLVNVLDNSAEAVARRGYMTSDADVQRELCRARVALKGGPQ